MYRYIGNKTKLLPYIMERTEELIGDHGTVADIMAGTGSVSLEYRKNGYTVVASDVMTYSYPLIAFCFICSSVIIFILPI